VIDYNPETVPTPTDWLALDEQERIDLIEDHHNAARIELPNAKVHAAFHAIVENQIAMDLEPVVRAMARLQREGLSRHDALHAIGFVAAEHVFDAMKSKKPDDTHTAQARYNAAVERLTAKSWRDQNGA
jgi:hypothetical protein